VINDVLDSQITKPSHGCDFYIKCSMACESSILVQCNDVWLINTSSSIDMTNECNWFILFKLIPRGQWIGKGNLNKRFSKKKKTLKILSLKHLLTMI
jgi:hypothetical protein